MLKNYKIVKMSSPNNNTIDHDIYKEYRDLADMAPGRRYGYHP